MNGPIKEKQKGWSTRFGFYLMAIGSAFGLGNIWRFPYVVAENGGGAFVLLYMVLVFLVGMPFLIGELFLGKVTKSPILGALKRLGQSPGDGVSADRPRPRSPLLKFSGFFSIFVCLLVLAYYSIICGWVMHFLMRFLVASLGFSTLDPGTALRVLMNEGWLQVLLTSVHLTIVALAVTRAFEEGFERLVGKVIPLFLLVVLFLAYKSMSLDSAKEAIRFFLYPDFSKLTLKSLGQAVGQVCFTLSLGFGTLVTYGSYMSQSVSVPAAGFRVAIFDSIVSIVAGALIFPLVFSRAGAEVSPKMLFETVPFLFSRMDGGAWYGLLFFFCLYIAALGASIGLLETAVSNIGHFNKKILRPQAAWIGSFGCLMISIVPSILTWFFEEDQVLGRLGLKSLDALLINWLLPIAALLLSMIIIRRLDLVELKGEFDQIPSASLGRLYLHWKGAVLWIAPILCILGLLLQFLT